MFLGAMRWRVVMSSWVRVGLGLHEWSVEEYGRLLETGGGKERMMRYFLVRILGCKIAGYCNSCLRHVSA